MRGWLLCPYPQFQRSSLSASKKIERPQVQKEAGRGV